MTSSPWHGTRTMPLATGLSRSAARTFEGGPPTLSEQGYVPNLFVCTANNTGEAECARLIVTRRSSPTLMMEVREKILKNSQISNITPPLGSDFASKPNGIQVDGPSINSSTLGWWHGHATRKKPMKKLASKPCRNEDLGIDARNVVGETNAAKPTES